jgi:hypothetical protein
MTQRFEHDWPPTVKYHRKARRIETVEILPSRLHEQPRIHINVHAQRRSIAPMVVTIGAFIFLALILFRAPSALLMLIVLIPSFVWFAAAVIVVVLSVVAINERRHGRPF